MYHAKYIKMLKNIQIHEKLIILCKQIGIHKRELFMQRFIFE